MRRLLIGSHLDRTHSAGFSSLLFGFGKLLVDVGTSLSNWSVEDHSDGRQQRGWSWFSHIAFEEVTSRDESPMFGLHDCS